MGLSCTYLSSSQSYSQKSLVAAESGIRKESTERTQHLEINEKVNSVTKRKLQKMDPLTPTTKRVMLEFSCSKTTSSPDEEDFFQIPLEVWEHIFTFLPEDKDLVSASMTCQIWKAIIDNNQHLTLRRSGISANYFGQQQWEKYFGDIGSEPSLPSNIGEIINGTCPFWPDKKIRDTHWLVLIPRTVNGKPLTLTTLNELIQNPKAGYRTNYNYYSRDVKEELADYSVSASYWVLMTQDVIPESRCKRYNEQKSLIKTYTKKRGQFYELPKVLEAAICILTEYVKSGKRHYSNCPWTYTRCQERVKRIPIAIGGFTEGGLNIVNFNTRIGNVNGIAGFRSFISR